MARITPVRPKYWSKQNPVLYVVRAERMYVRERAESIRNPQTERQQANRSKLAVASRFLAQMQPMVARGFRATMTSRPGWESRRVGAYHVALGELLSSGMRRGTDGWEVDYQNVRLAEGNSLGMYPADVKRSGRELSIGFPKGLPKGSRRVRMAIYSAREGQTVHVGFDAPRRGEVVMVSVPKWAASGALHVYYTVDVRGKSRWASAYAYVPKGRGRLAKATLRATQMLPGESMGLGVGECRYFAGSVSILPRGGVGALLADGLQELRYAGGELLSG